MEFEPLVRRKPLININWFVKLLPTGSIDGQKYKGYYTGIGVEIVDSVAIANLYNCGCYGKGSQSRGAPQLFGRQQQKEQPKEGNVSETLALDFEEAFFLAFVLDVLKIYDLQEQEMNWEQMLSAVCNINAHFLQSFSAYLYLKSKGWVIKSGIKLGGQFIIYKKGPRFFHASFLVIVVSPTQHEHFVGKNIKGTLRVAETAGKDVLLLTVLLPATFHPREFEDFDAVDVTELIVRRFHAAKYANKQKASVNKLKQSEQQQKTSPAPNPAEGQDQPLSKRQQKRLRKKEAANKYKESQITK